MQSETPGAEAHIVTSEQGDRLEWRGGVQATCGDKWIRADSMHYYEASGVLYLFDNVKYRDDDRTLEAERTTYYERQDRVRSEGNVRLTGSDGRSTLTGPVIDYFPANEERPLERIYAPESPHLKFYADTAAGPEEAPFEVDAERMNIYGDSRIAAAGAVVAVRGELTAYGDSLDFDVGRQELWLLDGPSVHTGDMILVGDSILVLMEESKVREIQAWPEASATGSELALQAPLLRLMVNGEDVERAIAAPGDPVRTGAVDVEGREPWSQTVSANYSLTADSIDIRRPGGQLERLIAVDKARATTIQPMIPGGGLMFSDWLEGDTITGFFAPPDSSLPEEERAQLDHLVASGHARALYHLIEEDEEGVPIGQPAINYVIGQIVTLFLEAGEVTTAQVVGPSTGVYLEPLPPAPDSAALQDTLAAPPDTTIVADTTAAPSPQAGWR
jgi:lipopolysaccharide export system protein LptA